MSPIESSGIHGEVYSLKLSTLLLIRGIKEGYDEFKLGTELVEEGGKFDDIIFKYKENGKERRRCIQAKHRLDGNGIIELADLRRDDGGNFSLPKYFRSYCDNIKGDDIKDLVICTNYNVHNELINNNYLAELMNDDKILGFKDQSGNPSKKRYRISNTKESLQLKESLQGSCGPIYSLAKKLFDFAKKGKLMDESNDEIFKKHHVTLIDEKVIDPQTKQFHQDFINDTNLSADASRFRRVILNMSKSSEWMKPKANKPRKLELGQTFGMCNGGDKMLPNNSSLAKKLFDCAKNGTKLDEADGIFKDHHMTLVRQKVIDRSTKQFHKDFAKDTPTALSAEALRLHEVFISTSNNKSEISTLWAKELNLGQNFGIGCERIPDYSADDTVVNEFFSKFVLAITPHEAEMDEIIKNELRNYYNNGAREQKLLLNQDMQWGKFFVEMLDWFKKKRNIKNDSWMTLGEGKQILDNIEVLINCFRVGSQDYLYRILKLLQFNDTEINRMKEELEKLMFDNERKSHNIKAISETNYLQTEGRHRSNKYEIQTSSSVKICANKVISALKMIKDYEADDSFLVVSARSLLEDTDDRWKRAFLEANDFHHLLVVICKEGTTNQEINFISRLIQLPETGKKKLLFVRELSNNENYGNVVKDDAIAYEHLSDATREDLLSKTISFQGVETSLRDLIANGSGNGNDGQPNLVLDSNSLAELLLGKEIVIPTQDFLQKYRLEHPNYIERQIQRILSSGLQFWTKVAKELECTVEELIKEFQWDDTSKIEWLVKDKKRIAAVWKAISKTTWEMSSQIENPTYIKRKIRRWVGPQVKDVRQFWPKVAENLIKQKNTQKNEENEVSAEEVKRIVEQLKSECIWGVNSNIINWNKENTNKRNSEILKAIAETNDSNFEVIDEVKLVEPLSIDFSTVEVVQILDGIANSEDVMKEEAKYLQNQNIEQVIEEMKKPAVTVISGVAGTGKSTILSHIYETIKLRKPNQWVIRVDLINHCELIENIDKQVEVIGFFVKHLSHFSLENSRFAEWLLMQRLKQAGNITFLFDGFDEISSELQNNIIKMIKALRQTKADAIYVTTRSHLNETLEQSFFQFACSLQNFTKEDQMSFLTNYWMTSTKATKEKHFEVERMAKFLVDKISTSLKDEEREFVGIPLQCRILAECFEPQLKEALQNNESIESLTGEFDVSLDLVGLYRKLMETKQNIYCEKKVKSNLTMKSIIESAIQERIEFLRKLAIETIVESKEDAAILLKHSETQLNESKVDKQKREKRNADLSLGFGLLNKTNQGKLEFLHRTYAEYLVADYIYQGFHLDDNEHNQLLNSETTRIFLVKKVFKEDLYEGVIRFFNGMLKSLVESDKWRLLMKNGDETIQTKDEWPKRLKLVAEVIYNVERNKREDFKTILYLAEARSFWNVFSFICDCLVHSFYPKLEDLLPVFQYTFNRYMEESIGYTSPKNEVKTFSATFQRLLSIYDCAIIFDKMKEGMKSSLKSINFEFLSSRWNNEERRKTIKLALAFLSKHRFKPKSPIENTYSIVKFFFRNDYYDDIITSLFDYLLVFADDIITEILKTAFRRYSCRRHWKKGRNEFMLKQIVKFFKTNRLSALTKGLHCEILVLGDEELKKEMLPALEDQPTPFYLAAACGNGDELCQILKQYNYYVNCEMLVLEVLGDAILFKNKEMFRVILESVSVSFMFQDVLKNLLCSDMFDFVECYKHERKQRKNVTGFVAIDDKEMFNEMIEIMMNKKLSDPVVGLRNQVNSFFLQSKATLDKIALLNEEHLQFVFPKSKFDYWLKRVMDIDVESGFRLLLMRNPHQNPLEFLRLVRNVYDKNVASELDRCKQLIRLFLENEALLEKITLFDDKQNEPLFPIDGFEDWLKSAMDFDVEIGFRLMSKRHLPNHNQHQKFIEIITRRDHCRSSYWNQWFNFNLELEIDYSDRFQCLGKLLESVSKSLGVVTLVDDLLLHDHGYAIACGLHNNASKGIEKAFDNLPKIKEEFAKKWIQVLPYILDRVSSQHQRDFKSLDFILPMMKYADKILFSHFVEFISEKSKCWFHYTCFKTDRLEIVDQFLKLVSTELGESELEKLVLQRHGKILKTHLHFLLSMMKHVDKEPFSDFVEKILEYKDSIWFNYIRTLKTDRLKICDQFLELVSTRLGDSMLEKLVLHRLGETLAKNAINPKNHNILDMLLSHLKGKHDREQIGQVLIELSHHFGAPNRKDYYRTYYMNIFKFNSAELPTCSDDSAHEYIMNIFPILLKYSDEKHLKEFVDNIIGYNALSKGEKMRLRFQSERLQVKYKSSIWAKYLCSRNDRFRDEVQPDIVASILKWTSEKLEDDYFNELIFHDNGRLITRVFLLRNGDLVNAVLNNVPRHLHKQIAKCFMKNALKELDDIQNFRLWSRNGTNTSFFSFLKEHVDKETIYKNKKIDQKVKNYRKEKRKI